MTVFKGLDPRTKLFIGALLSTVAVLSTRIIFLSAVLMLNMILLLLLGGKPASVFIKMKRLIFVIIAIAIVQSLFTETGRALIKIMDITLVTDHGLIRAIEFILRISIVFSSSLILLTSSGRDLIQGLLQLKVPYEIVFMISIAAKFLPILRDEMVNKTIAMELMGIDFKKIGIGKKMEAYRYLFLPITVNSILKSREMAIAMEMRGFRAMDTRTSFRQLSIKKTDYLFMFFTIIIIVILYSLTA